MPPHLLTGPLPVHGAASASPCVWPSCVLSGLNACPCGCDSSWGRCIILAADFSGGERRHLGLARTAPLLLLNRWDTEPGGGRLGLLSCQIEVTRAPTTAWTPGLSPPPVALGRLSPQTLTLTSRWVVVWHAPVIPIPPTQEGTAGATEIALEAAGPPAQSSHAW